MSNKSIISNFLRAYREDAVTLRRVGTNESFRVVFIFNHALGDYTDEKLSDPISLTEGAKLAADVLCHNANHICMILGGFVQHGIKEPGFSEAVSALKNSLNNRGKIHPMRAVCLIKELMAHERTILCTRDFEKSETYNISFLRNSDLKLTTGWISDPLDPVTARKLADNPNCENRWSAIAILDCGLFKSPKTQ